ncbi:cellulose synthase catalytic subunit (UDP-forming) [Acanthocystis turfacea Chlorella virus Can0610SP]|nr:cellulose synthase catalytic subunit (UDP-forming) [Acanthocystis turfacea Chlorella virus Can0610SP]
MRNITSMLFSHKPSSDPEASFYEPLLSEHDRNIILPSPPTSYEKYLYVKSGRWLISIFGLLSSTCLMTGMWLFIVATGTYWFSVFAAVSTVYLYVSYLMVNCVGKDFSLRVHRNIQKLNSTGCPAVDILLPVCGEDFEVIHNTWTYVTALDWPTKTVYVLDDKKDPKIRDLAQRFGFNYITRENNHMKKAGNLRNAFTKTTAPFFAIFDADFCPRPDYLKEIMPYFSHDGKIAIVQTPQFFEVRPDQTWVERAAGSVQELFYRFIQVSRDTFGGAVCVGTCAVYRREALVPFGGTAEIGFSEDVHTGFAVVDDGWKLKYIPLNLAKGVCPYELKSFFSQQYRWALGSTTLCTNPHFWKSNLSFRQKACFLSGMLYFQVTAFATVLATIPGLIMLARFPEHVLWFNATFALPSLIFGWILMPVWSAQDYPFTVNHLKVAQSYSHLFAIRDKLMNTAMLWESTGGAGAATSSANRFLQGRILCGLVTAFSLVFTYGMTYYYVHHGYALVNFLPGLFLTALNTLTNLPFIINRRD